MTVCYVNLSWFLSLHSGGQIHAIIEETYAIIQARRWRMWKREAKRRNKAKGKHLVGVPLQKNASDEVREEFEDVKAPNESRKL